jgi:hypothetical protein
VITLLDKAFLMVDVAHPCLILPLSEYTKVFYFNLAFNHHVLTT